MTRHPAAEVVEYDGSWPAAFAEVHAYVWPAVRDVAVAVEHVGSTAVPGLAAKPIIDLDVVVAELEAVAAAVSALAGIGYVHRGDQGITGREAFVAPESLPEHALYVVARDSQPYKDHIEFRDYLRAHPQVAERYADEKRRLAHLLPTDREADVNGKGWLVEEVLVAARRG